MRASDGPMKLLKVIKNPITNHLPVGCRKILMSFSASKVLNPREFVPTEDPIAIVVGAMAHGQVSYYYNNIATVILKVILQIFHILIYL